MIINLKFKKYLITKLNINLTFEIIFKFLGNFIFKFILILGSFIDVSGKLSNFSNT